ncbi:peptidylprolyl isomerase [Magnetovirga frankeli]|uniref:FKBP-type peptidyl-prolyl cis-trans isomerase n=1 Tax=Magnetovirga frankeli TaxID=947516 RepID=UPI001293B52A|nr:peptidylprolyl isomerase [gamma proteobacterium SS-5]
MSDSIQFGKFVSMTYVIADDQGNVLEQNDIPVSYVFGGEMELLGGVDRALRGKQAGDRVEIDISAADAGFGEHDPNLTFTDDIENVPEEFRQLGAEVQMQNDQGDVKSFFVTRIENGKLTVDGNHPLAGKNLKLTVDIKEVRDATPEDQQTASGASCQIN